jgi:hypothetical protein
MDIRKILKENAFGAATAYSHLSPLQVGILKKIASGNFDVDPANVSSKVHDAIEELVGFGMINDIDFSITEEGLKALNYAQKLGGSVARRQAMANKEKAFNADIGSNDNEFSDLD